MDAPFLSVHVARRDHPDQGAITAQREGDVQRTPIERLAEGVEARLLVAVPQVFRYTRICASVVRRVLPALWEVHHTQPDVQRVRSVGTIL
jgi:hypothetical protein